MQIAQVVGHAFATVKHASMTGWRLVLVQPLGVDDQPDGDPQLAADSLGAGQGTRVLICSDGKGAQKLVGSKSTPIRYFVMGLVD